MKIAISSTGKDLESEVDQRFGRCRFFIVADVDGSGDVKSFSAIENIHAFQQGGAGTGAAKLVADSGAENVITGSIGPRAFDVLSQFRMEIFSATGSVRDAIKAFSGGKLKKIAGPDFGGNP
jgi:predicted Fe-Mo cluster-binding NifX family protein